jgi:hypothetical protein
LPDNAGSFEDVKKGIVYQFIDRQFELGDVRTVLLLATHIRARFSYRLHIAGLAEVAISQSR